MDSAQDLIARPILSEEDLERQFRTTVDGALAAGLTSLHDAGFNPDSLAFFKRWVWFIFNLRRLGGCSIFFFV